MTDERMREALEAAIEAIEGLADQQAMPDDFYRPLLQKAREALSPPARRTNYEFERELLLLRLRSAIADKEWVTACANMETEHRDGWSCDWHTGMREAHNEIESIIATLAGLTPPGGESDSRGGEG